MPAYIASDIYWSVQEIADQLGMRYQSVYKKIQSGKLPAFKVPRGIILVRDADARNFIASISREV